MAFSTSQLVYIIISPIFSTIMTALNVPCMIVFTQKMRLASLSTLILANICACDIFVCIFSNNFYIFNISTPPLKWSTGSVSCKIFKTVTMMMNVSQILSLAVLCYDRMRRFTQPNTSQWNKKRGIQLLTAVWIIAAGLTLPRYFLFDEKRIEKFAKQLNKTVVIYNCKPVDLDSPSYKAGAAMLFAVGYAIPAISIITTLARTQWYAYKHRRMMDAIFHGDIPSATVEINRQLSFTFNLLGLLHVIIWTPFFVMSLLDLEFDLISQRHLVDLNFALRCTLLVLGSGKPIIYLLCLPKIREQLWEFMRSPVVRVFDNKMYSFTSSSDEHTPNERESKISVISRSSQESVCPTV